jgi:cytidylate kinase
LAKRLGFSYINTGAMYRAVTWFVRERGVDPADHPQVLDLLGSMQFEAGLNGGHSISRINGLDPTPYLSDPQVVSHVSAVASIPEVRHLLVEKQRQYLEKDNLVMEGRDIGSVVFPNTPFKFYIDASPEVRARRRALEGFKDEINTRDRLDSSRKTSPLVVSADAQVIDSSELTVEQVVQAVIDALKAQGVSIQD